MVPWWSLIIVGMMGAIFGFALFALVSANDPYHCNDD